MSFTDSIQSFIAEATRSVEHDRQAIVVGVGEALIDGTPVGEPESWKTRELAEWAVKNGYVGGHMKANWRTQVGSPINDELTDNGKPFAGPADVSGELAKDELRSNLGSGDCSVFITNNVPYCEKIDDGSYSQQAPAGIIDPVVADFTNIVAKAVQK